MWKLLNDATTCWSVLHSRETNSCKIYQFVVSLTFKFKIKIYVSPANTVGVNTQSMARTFPRILLSLPSPIPPADR